MISNKLKNYGRKHFKLFTNCHVSWTPCRRSGKQIVYEERICILVRMLCTCAHTLYLCACSLPEIRRRMSGSTWFNKQKISMRMGFLFGNAHNFVRIEEKYSHAQNFVIIRVFAHAFMPRLTLRCA